MTNTSGWGFRLFLGAVEIAQQLVHHTIRSCCCYTCARALSDASEIIYNHLNQRLLYVRRIGYRQLLDAVYGFNAQIATESGKR
ncbi:hypothetical protein D3C84_925700 [compost metagenome]